jgi:hypothetical protein
VLIGASIVHAQFSHGTAVILVLRDTVAYMGADGRTIVPNSNQRVDTCCKIITCGNTMIGVSGIGRFDSVQTVELLKNMMRQYPADHVLQNILRSDQKWKQILEHIKIDTVPASTVHFNFLGCEYTEGSFYSVRVEYCLGDSGPVPKIWRFTNIAPAILFEGYWDSIIAKYGTDTVYMNTTNPIVLIKNLIGIEAAKHPDEVGGDIDIVELTRNGIRWIQRKPQCKSCYGK